MAPSTLNYPSGEEWSWASPSVVSLLATRHTAGGGVAQHWCTDLHSVNLIWINVLWSIKLKPAKAWEHIPHYLWIILACTHIHHDPSSNYLWENKNRKLSMISAAYHTSKNKNTLFFSSVLPASKKPGKPLIISDIRKGSIAHRYVPSSYRANNLLFYCSHSTKSYNFFFCKYENFIPVLFSVLHWWRAAHISNTLLLNI